MLGLNRRSAEKQHECLQKKSSMEQREDGIYLILRQISHLQGFISFLFSALQLARLLRMNILTSH
jgi:adenine deaminase